MGFKYAVHSENHKDKMNFILNLPNVELSIIDLEYVVDSPVEIPELKGYEEKPRVVIPNPDAKKGRGTAKKDEDPVEEFLKEGSKGRGRGKK